MNFGCRIFHDVEQVRAAWEPAWLRSYTPVLLPARRGYPHPHPHTLPHAHQPLTTRFVLSFLDDRSTQRCACPPCLPAPRPAPSSLSLLGFPEQLHMRPPAVPGHTASYGVGRGPWGFPPRVCVPCNQKARPSAHKIEHDLGRAPDSHPDARPYPGPLPPLAHCSIQMWSAAGSTGHCQPHGASRRIQTVSPNRVSPPCNEGWTGPGRGKHIVPSFPGGALDAGA